MSAKIIFIDDREDVRFTYKRNLSRIFKDIAEVIAIEPRESIEEMLQHLDNIDEKVMYVIDEDLKHFGVARYSGAELIQAIRITDRKIPIYILTGYILEVDKNLEDVEFVIDKGEWNENAQKFAKRFLRHIDTYYEVKNNQEKRFDELLCKSLTTVLTEDEQKEFNALNLNRSKILINESVISTKDIEMLNDKEQKLLSIQEKLRTLSDE
jgi:tetrahydromethanopterin S-methyltransferase subunit G